GVRSGVDASTSAYLFTHPDLNDFMTTLKAMSREQVAAKVKGYMASHPDEQADMANIRQPLTDIKDRCGAPPSPQPVLRRVTPRRGDVKEHRAQTRAAA